MLNVNIEKILFGEPSERESGEGKPCTSPSQEPGSAETKEPGKTPSIAVGKHDVQKPLDPGPTEKSHAGDTLDAETGGVPQGIGGEGGSDPAEAVGDTGEAATKRAQSRAVLRQALKHAAAPPKSRPKKPKDKGNSDDDI